ncbi:hypothetical protein [Ideonella sp.]|uniref:hypothetical protein n=1 Tax=Ideonella sp. TaxID=1929293 RepID=UPI003BB6EA0A
METSLLIVGQTYYRLTFADVDMTIPAIEPLVYAGVHPSSQGKLLPTFQDTVSYTWVGAYPGPYRGDQSIDVTLHPMTDAEAAEMLALSEVVLKVNELFVRAERQGFPMLKPPRIPPHNAAPPAAPPK